MSRRIGTTAVLLGAVALVALAAAVPWFGDGPPARKVTVSVEVLAQPEVQQAATVEIVSTASRLPAR